MFARALVVGTLSSAAAGCFTSTFDPNLDATTTSAGVESGAATDAGSGSQGGEEATGSDAGSASSSGSASEGTSDGDVEGVSAGSPSEPEIVEVAVEPAQIASNGPIAVTVSAEHAEGVRMKLEDGAEVELAEAEPGVFVGEIAAMTGLLNGEHVAVLTPWAGEVEGEAAEAIYTIALPAPGSELFWEAGDLIGGGRVMAMGVTPDGKVVEWGHYGDSPRCYLRRRDKGGAWQPSDFQPVLPGVGCEAIDMKIAPSGSIVVLARRLGNDGWRWWLGEVKGWGAPATNRGLGEKDHGATALALHGSGMAAVCGSVPTQTEDGKDAATWLFRPGLAGESRVFDYWAEGDKAHSFAETIRDCAFAGDTLVMVGNVFGRHEKGKENQRDRHGILEFATQTKAEHWNVAKGTLWANSGAVSVVVDPDGHYLTAGHVCGHPCKQPLATLRRYDPEGPLLSEVGLGELLDEAWPLALEWSPAGYAVVAISAIKYYPFSFYVHGYAPGQQDPLWTYQHPDKVSFNVSIALAIGPFGEVYAGGFGSAGYPAVAYIGG